jgi:acetolactate decarboxylase
VDQAREASSLFAGDFSGTTTIEAEFSRSILGLGVMHDIEGEVISVSGETWFVPEDGTPRIAAPEDTIAFGIAAHGGIAHYLPLEQGLDIEGIKQELDRYLEATHVDHEQVVCALKIESAFEDVLLRTVGRPEFEGETLGDIIDAETRFNFETWSGTLVGFRYPDASTGATIPGLHLHAISADRESGGHVREATLAQKVVAALWIDDLHVIA